MNLCQILGLTKIQMGIKKIEKWKTKAHIVFLCHIVSIKVGKQGLDIFKLDKSCIYPLTPKLCLIKSSMKISGLGFQTWKFQKPPKNFILGWLRRIQASLFNFMIYTCLNLGQTYDLTKIQMCIKIKKKIRKMKNQST